MANLCRLGKDARSLTSFITLIALIAIFFSAPAEILAQHLTTKFELLTPLTRNTNLSKNFDTIRIRMTVEGPTGSWGANKFDLTWSNTNLSIVGNPTLLSSVLESSTQVSPYQQDSTKLITYRVTLNNIGRAKLTVSPLNPYGNMVTEISYAVQANIQAIASPSTGGTVSWNAGNQGVTMQSSISKNSADALHTVMAHKNTGYRFNKWTDEVGHEFHDSTLQIHFTGDTAFTAHFVKTYALRFECNDYAGATIMATRLNSLTVSDNITANISKIVDSASNNTVTVSAKAGYKIIAILKGTDTLSTTGGTFNINNISKATTIKVIVEKDERFLTIAGSGDWFLRKNGSPYKTGNGRMVISVPPDNYSLEWLSTPTNRFVRNEVDGTTIANPTDNPAQFTISATTFITGIFDVPTTSVVVAPQTPLAMKVGSTGSLTATLDGTNQNVTWSASPAGIATIADPTANPMTYTTVGSGLVTFTATASGTNFSGVHPTSTAQREGFVAIDSIIGIQEITINLGDPDFTIAWDIAPSNATLKLNSTPLAFSASSNASIATVSSTGLVHLAGIVGSVSTYGYIVDKDGLTYGRSFIITINDTATVPPPPTVVPVTNITWSIPDTSAQIGSIIKAYVKVYPDTATNKAYTITPIGTSVVIDHQIADTVFLRVNSAGNAMFVATATDNGKNAVLAITGVAPVDVQFFTLSKSSIQFTSGDAPDTLDITTFPALATADVDTILLSVSNASLVQANIITIAGSKKLVIKETGIGTSNVSLTLINKSGSQLQASVSVKTIATTTHATSIALLDTAVLIPIGGTKSIEAYLTPAGTVDSIFFGISPSGASISQVSTNSAIITGSVKGKYEYSAFTNNGLITYGHAEVYTPINQIILSQNVLKLYKNGEAKQITYIIDPLDADVTVDFMLTPSPVTTVVSGPLPGTINITPGSVTERFTTVVRATDKGGNTVYNVIAVDVLDSEVVVTPEPVIDSVIITPSSITALEGSTPISFTVDAYSSGAILPDAEIEIMSSNTSIFTVDTVAKTITPLSHGNAQLIALSGGKMGIAQVNIQEKILTKQLQLDAKVIDVVIGNLKTINLLSRVPSVVTDSTNQWRVADSTVLSVQSSTSNSITVKAEKADTIMVSLVAMDGSGVVASVLVRIREVKVPTIGIKINHNSLLLQEGALPVQVVATVFPDSATNKNVIWVSEDPSVFTFENGLVVPGKKGKAFGYAMTENGGFTARIYVEVDKSNIPLKTAFFNPSSLQKIWNEITGPDTVSIILWPPNASYGEIEVVNQNPKVATMPNDITDTLFPVNYTGMGYNEMYLRIDGHIYDTLNIMVNDTIIYVDKILLDTHNLRLPVGSTYTLNAGFTPIAPTNTKVKWSTDNPTIASIESTTATSNQITINDKGQTIVRVVSDDGNKMDICMIEGYYEIASITALPDTLILEEGASAGVIVEILPAQADQSKEFTSLDATIATVNSNGIITAQNGAGGKWGQITVSSPSQPDKICTVHVFVKPKTSIIEQITKATSVYPSPAKENEMITLTLPNDITYTEAGVYDSYGRQIVDISNMNYSYNTTQMTFSLPSDSPSGVYFIRLHTKEGMITKPFSLTK